MGDNMTKLEALKDGLKAANSKTIRLYLITRHLKPDVSASQKVLKKYVFNTSKIDLAADLKEYFKALLVDQVEGALLRKDMEMCEYAVIDDNLQNKIYTYALNNALAFADVITQQLPNVSKIKSVSSLKDVKDSLWAYCIQVEINGKPVYSFRKIGKSRVGTDDNDKDILQKIWCTFDTTDAKLEILEKETIHFDEKIDCICIGSQFFVFKKGGFESMVGLEDEFKEQAESVVNELKKSNAIEGIELMIKELSQSRALSKRLAVLAKKDDFSKLDKSRIQKMQKLARKFKENFKVKDGKALLEEPKDINVLVRLLSDYYKKGESTGHYYGSHAGKLVEPVTAD